MLCRLQHNPPPLRPLLWRLNENDPFGVRNGFVNYPALDNDIGEYWASLGLSSLWNSIFMTDQRHVKRSHYSRWSQCLSKKGLFEIEPQFGFPFALEVVPFGWSTYRSMTRGFFWRWTGKSQLSFGFRSDSSRLLRGSMGYPQVKASDTESKVCIKDSTSLVGKNSRIWLHSLHLYFQFHQGLDWSDRFYNSRSSFRQYSS